MLKHIFVTGTHEGVGKTVVARSLLQAFSGLGHRVAGLKPIMRVPEGASSREREKTIEALRSCSSINLAGDVINPYILQEEGADCGTGSLDYSPLSAHLRRLSGEVDHVIVSGCTGWEAIISDSSPIAKWVIQEKMPVILAVGIQQGCINHAILTANAIKRDGLPLLGWVANRINPCMSHYFGLIDILSEKLGCPLLGEIPYMSHPENKNLAPFIDLSKIAGDDTQALMMSKAN